MASHEAKPDGRSLVQFHLDLARDNYHQANQRWQSIEREILEVLRPPRASNWQSRIDVLENNKEMAVSQVSAYGEMTLIAEGAMVRIQRRLDQERRDREARAAVVPPPPPEPATTTTVAPNATPTLNADGSGTGPIMADAADEAMMRRAQGTFIGDDSSPTGYRNQFTGEPGTPTLDGETAELEEVIVESSSIAIAPTDHRVRVKPLNAEDFYGSTTESNTEEQANDGHLLQLIKETNGVIFPYTPSITYGHQVNYSSSAPVHANQDYQFYNNTPSVQFQISAKFTAQNTREAQYLLAAKHFFQTASKMRFGEDDEKRGLPPPILVFSGYGDFMFNNLPVIMTNFTVDLPDDQDYVQVDLLDATSWVPAMMTFQLTFIVQQTPKKQRAFNFDRFASGEQLKARGWI
jgi:hypothetical protein